MTVPVRRTPIALLLCYGFASAIVGGFADEALAQSAPLRVDPVLLGLPPAKPAETPAPATPEKPRTEVRPAETPAVEVRPVAAPAERAPRPMPEDQARPAPAAARASEVEAQSASNRDVPREQPEAPVERPQSAGRSESVPSQPVPQPVREVPAPAVPAAPAPQAPVRAPVQTQTVSPPPQSQPTAPSVEQPASAPVAPLGRDVPKEQPEAPVVRPASVPSAPALAVPETARPPQPAPVRRPESPQPVAVPQPVPATAPTPALAAPAPVAPVAPARQQPPAVAAPAPAYAPEPRAAATSLAPLRVDPALLGAPPAVVATPVVRPAVAGAPAPVSGAKAATVAPGGQPAVAAAPGTPVAASGSAVASTASAPRQVAAAGGYAVTPAEPPKPWYLRAWDTVTAPYDKGTLEFYLPLHTHHLRSKYSQEQIDSYQETPYGFGVGKGFYNEKGNWEGVYAMAFQDSHFKPMYSVGYGWKAIWNPSENTRFGLGYTAGLMARTDIFNYVPFPVLLPMASFAYKNLSLEGTYVPGGQGNGNIFFIWAKWELGKPGQKIGTPAPKPEPQVQYADTRFGPQGPQRVPYGPVVVGAEGAQTAGASVATGPGSASGSAVQGGIVATGASVGHVTHMPPMVAATGQRDEIYVPDPTPALALRPAKGMTPPPKNSETPRPVFLSAYRMGGEVDREFAAEGDAELRKIGTVLNADQLTYWPIDDEVEAQGNVRLQQGEDVVTGPRMRMKLEDQVGFFEQPSYTLKREPAPGSKGAAAKAFARSEAAQGPGEDWLSSGFATPRVIDIKPGQTKIDTLKRQKTTTEAHGDADRIDFEGENQVRLSNATYTTCVPGNNDWYARASKLKLDYDREVGEGEDATIYFKDVPILYSPWLSFSLNNERKSGFLAPSFGTDSDSGFIASAPYYWNIAPNMDATLRPRLMTKRGLQLGGEYRYLNTAFGGVYSGKAQAEVLPSDNLRDGDTRYGYSLSHLQTTPSGFTGTINYTKVSDDYYYTDLSSDIGKTSTTQLLQQGMLTYGGGGWWSATANFQQYQTLQPDPKNPVLEQYRMLPQFTLNARRPDLFDRLDGSFLGQYTNFTKRGQMINGVQVKDPDGQRTVLYPQLAVPFETPGWYITPKVGLNATYYALTDQAAGIPGSQDRVLPVFSIDSGMTFERSDTWFGREYTQTLEPRLYYLNVPYKNQDKIPIFDSGVADFNFAQIFSENQFTGWDRFSNANQLTAALSSRLIEPNSGAEIFRAMVGQRFYFERNKVGLTPAVPSATTQDDPWHKSDFLAAFSGQVLPRVYADVAWQYNPADRQTQRYSMGGRYQPEPGKVFSAAYRYNRDPNTFVDQVDFSGQWPLTGKLYAVGRLNYSLRDNPSQLSTAGSQGGRMIEALGGLEYNGGCWVLRGVIQRQALTQDNSKTQFFVQLELNDFSRIGSNPLNLLKRSVQGYGLINQPAADINY